MRLSFPLAFALLIAVVAVLFFCAPCGAAEPAKSIVYDGYLYELKSPVKVAAAVPSATVINSFWGANGCPCPPNCNCPPGVCAAGNCAPQSQPRYQPQFQYRQYPQFNGFQQGGCSGGNCSGGRCGPGGCR